MGVKIHPSEDDFLIPELRKILTELFLIQEVKDVMLNENNIAKYSYTGKKIGDSISVLHTRQYSNIDDLEILWKNRLREHLKIEAATEEDSLFDEINFIESLVDDIQKYDLHNPHKGIARRYIDFLKNRLKIPSPTAVATEQSLSPCGYSTIQFKKNAAERIFKDLHYFFDTGDQDELRSLLNGNPLTRRLTYKNNISTLIEYFRRVKSNAELYANGSEVVKWLLKNFNQIYRNTVKQLNNKTVEAYLYGKKTIKKERRIGTDNFPFKRN